MRNPCLSVPREPRPRDDSGGSVTVAATGDAEAGPSQWQCRYFAHMWWVPAVGLAAALKAYFSVAAALGLNWILEPVAVLLNLLAGWTFARNPAGEWFSLDAGIVLVKACAGGNFMIMSFIGWCWLLLPRQSRLSRRGSVEWTLLLGSSLALAWGCTLLVNTLRILAIVHWQPALEHWLPSAEAHRLMGVVIYLVALNLQLVSFQARHWRRALQLAAVIYFVLMLMVPVVTGNAAERPELYLRHILTTLAVMLPFLALSLVRSARGPGAPRWLAHVRSRC